METRSFFDSMPSKTAFWFGFTTAILTMGTLGFLLLGSCLMNNSCPALGQAAAAKTAVTTTPTTTTQPTKTTAGPIPVVDKDDHVLGKDSAQVTFIEYSDFECPFCGAFHPTVQQLMTEYGDKVRWVYRHFPLSFHPEAMPAAEAAECAGEQGKFWEYADELFGNQDLLGADYYPQLAKELGLDAKKFQDCLDSDRTLAGIQQDQQEGAAAGVTGTPGSFIIDANGEAQVVKGALPYASVKAMIDAALAAK